jgi:type VI secretion system protein ImpG
MEIDEHLYRAFLEEMNALENFRMNYAAAHPSVPLESDDPDVRRLMEALALFSARTRIASLENVVSSRRRIFQQTFPYLLTPLPAMAMLQARPTGQFVEPAILPKGSETAISPKSGGSAIFRGIHDLRIFPIALTELKMLLLPNKGFRLLLVLETPYPRNDHIGELPIHINHLNDYNASLRVFHTFRECLARISVVFNERATETSSGVPCDYTLGAPGDAAEGGIDDETPHPLQKERLFFHYPQQELFLNIQIPPPPRNWRRFTLCLDLNPQWPRSLILNKEVFQLFAVPIVNLRRGMAQPMICTGAQERYVIRHPMPEYGFKLQAVLGVYEVTKSGMAPIRAGILSGGRGSYEVERTRNDSGVELPYLSLHFPEAFETPKTVAVDALWLQPWFSDVMAQKHSITPYSRDITGVKWELLGDIMPHGENRFSANTDGFMHLMTLGNKHFLNFEDLCGLLRTLNVTEGHFKKAFQLLSDLRVVEVPCRGNGSACMLKHIYYLHFKGLDPGARPLVETFAARVGRMLDAWMAHATVEVKVETAENGQPAIEERGP